MERDSHGGGFGVAHTRLRREGYIKTLITYSVYVFVLMFVHCRGRRRLALLQALGVGG